MWIWLLTHKKLVACLLALLAAASVGAWLAWKMVDASLLKAQHAIEAAEAARDAALEANRQAEASADAAKQARATNDRELGRIRSDTQGRVDRAGVAGADQRVLDVQAALDAYAAAADSVRAAHTR